MLEKPEIQDNKIIACMQAEYGLRAAQITFLPLGADPNTAVYRATAGDAAQYFVKFRSGVFDETSVALPKFLSDQGITHIIAPLTTTSGQLWANLGIDKLMLSIHYSLTNNQGLPRGKPWSFLTWYSSPCSRE